MRAIDLDGQDRSRAAEGVGLAAGDLQVRRRVAAGDVEAVQHVDDGQPRTPRWAARTRSRGRSACPRLRRTRAGRPRLPCPMPPDVLRRQRALGGGRPRSAAPPGRAARWRRTAPARAPARMSRSCSVWYSTPAWCSKTKRVQPSSIDVTHDWYRPTRGARSSEGRRRAAHRADDEAQLGGQRAPARRGRTPGASSVPGGELARPVAERRRGPAHRDAHRAAGVRAPRGLPCRWPKARNRPRPFSIRPGATATRSTGSRSAVKRSAISSTSTPISRGSVCAVTSYGRCGGPPGARPDVGIALALEQRLREAAERLLHEDDVAALRVLAAAGLEGRPRAVDLDRARAQHGQQRGAGEAGPSAPRAATNANGLRAPRRPGGSPRTWCAASARGGPRRGRRWRGSPRPGSPRCRAGATSRPARGRGSSTTRTRGS